MRARSRRRAARCGSRAGPSIVITIDDDGPGIRPDAIDKIFERFYTDRPQQSFGQNSGLGLSISKQIVEAHGGRLTAQNRVASASPHGHAKAGDKVVNETIVVETIEAEAIEAEAILGA